MNKDVEISDFMLNIEKVFYGFKKDKAGFVKNRDFGDSNWDQINVNCIDEECNNCNDGQGWEQNWSTVQQGVAMVLINNIWWCSGTLISDRCNTGSPFFLTSFQCLDHNEDYILDENEKNELTNWSFRFYYEITNCNDPYTEPSEYVTYTEGADFLSGWDNTDFLLLELKDEVNGIPFNEINYEEVEEGNKTCIHHPMGDVKKIAIDDDPMGSFNTFHYIENWEEGEMQNGSAGSPLFDNSNKVIGQFSGWLLLPSLEEIDLFGKTSSSWDGGGTPETSLSFWLGESPLTFTSENPSCGLNNGNATVTVECGNPPYSYQWSNGATTQTIENLSAGTFYVTITDNDGFTNVGSIEIESEIIVPGNVNFWSTVVSEYGLDQNEIQNRNIFVESQLRLDIDYIFTDVNFSFKSTSPSFAGFNVEEGINVEINDSELNPCFPKWSYIETWDNSTLTMNNSIVYRPKGQFLDFG